MTGDVFAVCDVSTWERAAVEAAGRDPKDWRYEPSRGMADETETGSPRPRPKWMFKPIIINKTDGFAQGEDWSEKLAAEIGNTIHVPCARVELAICDEEKGSISRDLRPSGWDLFSGSDLLAGIVEGYQPQQRGRTGHTLDNIAAVLDGLVPPPGSVTPDGFSAFDVFAGFLTFDALIANQDRHEENWSILRRPDGSDALAGSYDHASSLGFNLRDHERERRLREKDGVQGWAQRGRATRFEHAPGQRAVTLTTHARAALKMANAAARAFWLDTVAALRDDDVAVLVDRIPELSQPARNFVTQLVSINRRRILDEC